MSTILITGANKGLGHEAARRLVAAGHEVWAAARDPERGRAAAEDIRAHPLVLDVTDDASVRSAASTLGGATGGVLDVLINNAGISGGRVSAGDLTAEKMKEVYDVNVFGPVRVLHAFLPLLERSATSPAAACRQSEDTDDDQASADGDLHATLLGTGGRQYPTSSGLRP